MGKKLQVDTEAVFKDLKRQNGEAVARLIRDNHLDDIPNIVHVLEFAGRDPDEVETLVDILRETYKNPIKSEYETDLKPLELLDLAGYDAYVVETREQKNAIKKYFRPHEELCTFRDPTRHIYNYIINAVKRGAENIEPSEHPQRQDEYGTSVISIQISKKGGYISIKNRYNHSVKHQNPDATFNNNPDNIIPGLTNSLKKFFNVEFNTTDAEIPNNYHVINDQYLHYNYEVENTYFGADYYSKGSDITKLDKRNGQYMIDYFIWDAQEKKLLSPSGEVGTTYRILRDMLEGKNVRIENNPLNKNEKIIFADGIDVIHTIDGKISELNLSGIREIGEGFLEKNKTIKKIEIPDLEVAGEKFLYYAENLTEFHAPKLRSIRDNALRSAVNLSEFDAPNLMYVGNNVLYLAVELTNLYLPNLTDACDGFLRFNRKLTNIYAPQLVCVGADFLAGNTELKSIDLPSLRTVRGKNFIAENHILNTVNLPNLSHIEDGFLRDNEGITDLFLPSLEFVRNDFMFNNKRLQHIFVPKLRYVGDNFLNWNLDLRMLFLPELECTGSFFLCHNTELEKIFIPKLKKTQRSFLADNKKMKEFDAPELEDTDGPLFLMNNVLERVNTPNLSEIWRAGLSAKVIRNATQKIQKQMVEPEHAPSTELCLGWGDFGNSSNYPK